MKPKHWRLIGIGAAILVLVAGYFVMVSPNRAATAQLKLDSQSQEQASQQLRSRISLLKKQNEEIPAQLAALAAVEKRMPDNAAIPTLIRNITGAAADASVTLASITPSQPVAMEAPQAAPTAPADSEDASGDSDSEEAASEQAPAEAAAVRVQRLPLSITACGSYAELRKYLSKLEGLNRAMSVSGVNIARGTCGSSTAETDLTATISASVFILPKATEKAGTEAAEAAAGTGPAAGTAAASGSGATSNGAPS